VVLTKVRINTSLKLRIKVTNVKYLGDLDSVNCNVCCERIRIFRDNER